MNLVDGLFLRFQELDDSDISQTEDVYGFKRCMEKFQA